MNFGQKRKIMITFLCVLILIGVGYVGLKQHKLLNNLHLRLQEAEMLLLKVARETATTTKVQEGQSNALDRLFRILEDHCHTYAKDAEYTQKAFEKLVANFLNYFPAMLQAVTAIRDKNITISEEDFERIKYLLKEDDEAGKVVEAFDLSALIKLVVDQGFTVTKKYNGIDQHA